jgi:hypothetical protein
MHYSTRMSAPDESSNPGHQKLRASTQYALCHQMLCVEHMLGEGGFLYEKVVHSRSNHAFGAIMLLEQVCFWSNHAFGASVLQEQRECASGATCAFGAIMLLEQVCFRSNHAFGAIMLLEQVCFWSNHAFGASVLQEQRCSPGAIMLQEHLCIRSTAKQKRFLACSLNLYALDVPAFKQIDVCLVVLAQW